MKPSIFLSSIFFASASRVAHNHVDLVSHSHEEAQPDKVWNEVTTFLNKSFDGAINQESWDRGHGAFWNFQYCTQDNFADCPFNKQKNPGWQGQTRMIFPYFKFDVGTEVRIHEEAKAMMSNHFVWSGPDGLGDFGRITSKANKNNFMSFKDPVSNVVKFKMRQSKKFTNKPRFVVTDVNDKVLYTIRKWYHYKDYLELNKKKDGQNADKFRSNLPEEVFNGFAKYRKQYMQIFFGECDSTEPKCWKDWPVYEAIGSKSREWEFYRNTAFSGVEADTSKHVASMKTNTTRALGRGDDKDFWLEMKEKSGQTDVGALMAAVSMASLHQNSRNKGQWRLGKVPNAVHSRSSN